MTDESRPWEVVSFQEVTHGVRPVARMVIRIDDDACDRSHDWFEPGQSHAMDAGFELRSDLSVLTQITHDFRPGQASVLPVV